MWRFWKEVIVVVLALLTLASAAWGERKAFSPLPPDIRPSWTAVPGVAGVQYAPNVGADVFRHGGQYYYYHHDAWYQGKSLAGPWTSGPTLPPAFYQIGAPYFKTPPGWAKGKKTGWQGAPMPPGQMKKSGGGGLPPGQMKKMYGK
jgi:hypothetical protein